MFMLCACRISFGSQPNCCFPYDLTSPKMIDHNSDDTQDSRWQQINAAE